MTRLRQPLKWHGGKYYLADWIISHFPEDFTHYVEPYFGGGAVLLRQPEGRSEVVNDINHNLMTFWAVLRSPGMFRELRTLLENTPLSEGIFNHAKTASHDPTDDFVAQAWRFFVTARQSRQGLCKDFATLSRNRTRRGINEQASQWLRAIEGLEDVHRRLRGVVILNRPALEVIQQQDGENTLFMLDPPYLAETRTVRDAYAYEMSTADHIELLELLADIEGRFVLCGYPSDLYAEYADACNWRQVTKQIDNKAASGPQKRVMTECLWMNY